MRKSHERNIEPDVSQEMKDVHTLLSNIFADLRDTVSFPFEINKREEIYQDIWKNIKQNIIDKNFNMRM